LYDRGEADGINMRGQDEALLNCIPITASNLGCVGPEQHGLQELWSLRNPSGTWVAIENRRGPNAALPMELDCLLIQSAERMDDLSGLLRRNLGSLHDSGALILDLPQPTHWQPPWGTHSDGSVKSLLSELGLQGVEQFPIVADVSDFTALRLGSALETNQAALGSRIALSRVAWRAMRRPPTALRLVQRVLPPIAGVYDARTGAPMRGLATLPGFSGLSSVRPSVATVAGKRPTIVIDQRQTYSVDSLPFIRRLRRLGCILVAEADDDPDHWPGHAQTGYLSFRATHAVQTSTDALAARLRIFNPETRVLPNSLETLPKPRNFRRQGRLTLFFGALNRFADLAPLLPELNAALAAAGGRLAVEVVHDRAAFDAIETPHKRFTPTAAYAAYRSIMGDCEVALLPLRDTAFNRMKSDLKFVEAAGSRLVSIASPIGYARSIKHGETGLIARDGAEWRACLEALLADPGRALQMADNARAEVARSRMLADATAERFAWYCSLLDRRAELDAALLDRVPELGECP